MPANFNPPGYRWFHFFRNAPIRVGSYTGVWLALVFVAWVLIANRVACLRLAGLECADAGVPNSQPEICSSPGLLQHLPCIRARRRGLSAFCNTLLDWYDCMAGASISGYAHPPLNRFPQNEILPVCPQIRRRSLTCSTLLWSDRRRNHSRNFRAAMAAMVARRGFAAFARSAIACPGRAVEDRVRGAQLCRACV